MPVGVFIAVIALVSVVAVYFWVVRPSGQEQQPK
jgi:hypothetical protein